MVTNIIQIGNSKGIILPSEILKQLRLSLKSAVSISLDGNNIVIKAQPRQGWAEAYGFRAIMKNVPTPSCGLPSWVLRFSC